MSKSLLVFGLTVFYGAVSMLASAESVVYNCDFCNGLKDARAYYKKGPNAKLEAPSNQKTKTLKVTPSPKRKLSGIRLKDRPELEAGNLYKISVEVKGSARAFIGVFGPAKWGYSKKVSLTGSEWKKLELEYFMPSKGRISLYVFGWKAKQGQHFYVKNVRVEKKETAKLSNSPVAPVWIEAEHTDLFRATKIKSDPEASAGQFTFGKRWYGLAEIELPATSQPLYFWLRVKSFGENTAIRLHSKRLNAGKKAIPHDGKWHWVKFGPVNRIQAGSRIKVSPQGKNNAAAGLDAIVLATNPETIPQTVRNKNAHNGTLSIGKVKSVPVIDGILNDDCWKDTIAVKPFVLQRQNSFAQAQTVARMAYDKENLYFSFKCDEPCLDPKANVLHKFKRNITKGDNPNIFSDDCVVLLFAPKEANQGFYDLAINANGIIQDAFYPAPEFWRGRDLKWQSQAHVKTFVGNGFWTVEGRIHLKSFGSTFDKKRLGVLFGRIRQPEKEISAWQPLQSGFHMPSNLGELVFEDNVPALDLQNMGQFRRGNNDIQINLTRSFNSPLEPQIRVQPSGKSAKIFNQLFGAENKQLKSKYTIDTNDLIAFQYNVVDPGSFKAWYKSPVYHVKVNSSTLKAEMSKNLNLFVNAQKYNRNCQLQKGINVIALEAKASDTLTLTAGPVRIPLDGVWLFSKNNKSGWTGSNFKADDWEKITLKGGSFPQSGFYRKLLVLEQSEVWPNWEKKGLTLCRESLQPFYFLPKGIKGKKVRDYKVAVEVPETIKVIGASGFYKQNKDIHFKALGTIVRNGKKFNKYECVIPGNLSFKKKLPFWGTIAMFMKAESKATTPAAMYYYCSANEGVVQEVPRKLDLKFTPAPKGKQPKKLIIQMWPGYLNYLNDTDLQKQMLQEQAAMGINQFGNIGGFGIKKFVSIDFASWSIDCRPYLKEHPEHALVDFKGRRKIALKKRGRYNNICTTALLTQPEALNFLKRSVVNFTKSKKAKNVIWDYEQDVFESYIACYCPRCMKAFSDKYNIKSANLNPEIIKKKYDAQWIDFMTSRMADISALFTQGVHAAGTGAIFSVYSAYQSELSKREYAVDWSKLNGKIDLGSCGYGRPLREMKATINGLGKTPVLLGAIARPYNVDERGFPTYCSKTVVLRRIFDSRKGMLVYAFNILDGRTFYALGEVSRLAAEYEDLITEGRNGKDLLKVEGIIPDDYYVFFDDTGRCLIALFNSSSKPKKFKFSVKKITKGKNIYDYYAGKQKVDGEVVTGKIPGKDVKLFIVE